MKKKPARGYIHLYTGTGKGKTTAAVGLAVRAAGAGLSVYLGQFAKGRFSSEHESLRRIGEKITVRLFGQGTFIPRKPTVRDRRLARSGLAEAAAAMSGGAYDMVILDEAAFAVRAGVLSCADLCDVVLHRDPRVDVVITGRDAPDELVEIADCVTEMREVKHYWRKGVRAREGIEY